MPPQEIRAVFLLNLTRFVRWPDGAFPVPDAPLIIGTLEGDPVGDTLQRRSGGEGRVTCRRGAAAAFSRGR